MVIKLRIHFARILASTDQLSTAQNACSFGLSASGAQKSKIERECTLPKYAEGEGELAFNFAHRNNNFSLIWTRKIIAYISFIFKNL